MFVEHKEAVEVTEAPAKTLKLSEAIRIGATYRPQVRGVWFSHANGGSCALGAAWEGAFGKVTRETWAHANGTELALRFGIPSSIISEIAKRNDQGLMSREQIANWLEAQGL